MEFATNRESIVVNGEEVKDVEEFAYLGAIERRCERLFCGIGVGTRISKGEKQTKDSKRKSKGKRQGDMEELDCGWGGDTQQGGWADNMTALCTYWPNER
ncbi:hypothetical protein pdam_00017129 [Pocillopora damicornis]|uniref:Uncharacterized protein n=1 Tax=Pocillopora damicornis TaxID=46731 RepID=A0A3M6U4W5_POCDA|nr:hypothetical protein pdam_00017129 [Pocillopora damicornis]